MLFDPVDAAIALDEDHVKRNQGILHPHSDFLIAAEIKKGAASVDAVGRRLKAGTNCGACKPEIGKLLRGAARPASQPA